MSADPFPPLSRPPTEDEVVAAILARMPVSGGGIRVGPGQDCALLDAPGGKLVVTTDVLVDGVHFRLSECGPEAAARSRSS